MKNDDDEANGGQHQSRNTSFPSLTVGGLNSENGISEYVTQTHHSGVQDQRINKLKHQNTQLLFQNIKLKQENDNLNKKMKELEFNYLRLQREL